MNKYQSKHSKDPWRIEGDKVKTAISSGCKHVAMVNYFDCGPGDPHSISKEEHEANAKLIVAAPDMSKVLFLLNNRFELVDDEFGVNFTNAEVKRIVLIVDKVIGDKNKEKV